jgi:hypothetical protein
LNRKLWLQFLNLPGQVPDLEKAMRVDSAGLIHVISTHVRQARCREIDSRAGHHTVLYRNVFEMIVLNPHVMQRLGLSELSVYQ